MEYQKNETDKKQNSANVCDQVITYLLETYVRETMTF